VRSTTFATKGPLLVGDRQLTPISLIPPADASDVLAVEGQDIVFLAEGWYEVLLEVHWDPDETTGTRFAHTKIPDQHPLHSEAINARVLTELTAGRQLLRGNAILGREETSRIRLEVWQDTANPVQVSFASLEVRELRVPWS
jgi:hypothetical protein